MPYNQRATPTSPIYGGAGGRTPSRPIGADMMTAGGNQAGYSPTTKMMSPAYGRGPGTTPRYNPGGTTPGYYGGAGAGYGGIGAGTSPAYAPNAYSPGGFGAGAIGGAATPGYNPGGMSGMQLGYRPGAGQSPAYD